MCTIKSSRTLGLIGLAVSAAALVFTLTGCPNPANPTDENPDASWSGSVGDTGPGGGTVFYDDEIGFDFDGDGTIQDDEKNFFDNISGMTTYRYLEFGAESSSTCYWLVKNGNPGSTGTGYTTTTGTQARMDTMGTGKATTEYLETFLSDTVSAVYFATSYSNSGRSDWFVPSIGELYVLAKKYPGKMPSYSYTWTSNYGSTSNAAWVLYSQTSGFKSFDERYSYLSSYKSFCRPIRAF